MKPPIKRALSLLLSAAFIVVSLVVYVSLIRPEYDDVLKLRGELESKSNILNQQSVAITQVQKLIAQYRGVATLSDTLSLVLPIENNISSIISQLNAIAGGSGMLMQSVNISYPPIKPSKSKLSFVRDVGALQLDLKLFGPYASLKKFLQYLETNIRIMDVKELKVESGGKYDQDVFNYSLTVDTYYQIK